VRCLAVLIALIVVLASRPATAADTYTIDVLMPLTGPAAFVGQAQQQAAHVYETIVNRSGGIHGQPLHFEIHDDQEIRQPRSSSRTRSSRAIRP
jgi:ABC-type branched-subunit amino acid transport system substrate-binding protein